MRHNFLISILVIFIYGSPLNGQDTPEIRGLKSINEDVIKAQMDFLASDWMEGRAAGEKGERMAGDYIASMLQLYGVKPYGDIPKSRSGQVNQSRTYFQNFVLLKTLPGEEQAMQIRSVEGKTVKATSLTKDVDFTIWATDPAFELTAPVVFAGYAYKNDQLRFNDFTKLDIRGKFVLKISGFPKFAADKMSQSEQFSAMVKMDSVLRAMGAVGIIEFNPDLKVVGRPDRPDYMNMSPAEGNQTTGRPRASYSIPGERINDAPKRVQISVKAANEILKGSNISIEEYMSKADLNQPASPATVINKEIYIKTSVKTSQVAVRNIIGIIEGRKADEVIVLGAHYDHVGIGNGYIWNGADDNASGTVGIMTLAKAIKETGVKPEKTLIFALWTSEEAGLLGSRYYLDNLEFPVNNIKLNLNFDMISRYITDSEPTKVTMTYTDKYPFFKDITATNLNKYGIDLIVDYQPSNDPPGGSDHRSFVAKGITVMRFKPGHREEYHKPGDENSTINWDIMEKIIRISYLNIWQLANSEW
jgi:hypothetical protein